MHNIMPSILRFTTNGLFNAFSFLSVGEDFSIRSCLWKVWVFPGFHDSIMNTITGIWQFPSLIYRTDIVELRSKLTVAVNGTLLLYRDGKHIWNTAVGQTANCNCGGEWRFDGQSPEWACREREESCIFYICARPQMHALSNYCWYESGLPSSISTN